MNVIRYLYLSTIVIVLSGCWDGTGGPALKNETGDVLKLELFYSDEDRANYNFSVDETLVLVHNYKNLEKAVLTNLDGELLVIQKRELMGYTKTRPLQLIVVGRGLEIHLKERF
jgi:hypothetical protein